MSEIESAFGQQHLSTQNNEFNVIQFLIAQATGRMNTATVVKVVGVSGIGVNPVGFVDVIPQVNQLDGADVAVPHGTVFQLPYARIQGGANAVIVDPQVNDLGIAVFAQADISAVKSSKAAANPGSKRRFDMADGMYIGGLLNGTPTRYVTVDDTGIKIHGAALVTIEATEIVLNGHVTLNGTMNATGDVLAQTVSLHNHITTGVEPGGGLSGPPKV